MRMDAGLDTGPVLLERRIPIHARDTTGTLTEKLAGLGAEAIVEALDRLDSLVSRAQDESKATYAAKVDKAEARIDWTQSAAEIDRRIRAFNPAPGAETTLNGGTLKIWEATVLVDGRGPAGSVLEARDGQLLVACGAGALGIDALQRSGSRRMSASEFLRGAEVVPGTVLGAEGTKA